MNRTAALAACLTTLLLGAASGSAFPVVVIEPDDFADLAVLNNVSPVVTLSTGAFDDNRPTFDVVAATDAADASTGTKVFAHAGGIAFFNTTRTLRMDFPSPPRMIELDYIASGFFDEFFLGRIEGYDAAGNLIAFDETELLAEAEVETLTLAAPGIAYALAFPPADSFGDFDFLRITVPEPSGLALVLLAAAAGWRWRNAKIEPRPASRPRRNL